MREWVREIIQTVKLLHSLSLSLTNTHTRTHTHRGCVVGVFTVTLVLSYSANENFNVTHTQNPSRQIRAVIFTELPEHTETQHT